MILKKWRNYRYCVKIKKNENKDRLQKKYKRRQFTTTCEYYFFIINIFHVGWRYCETKRIA